ncbi:hypothetical protein [Rubrivirga sp. IMCC45206]|uniref:hypothetical protein n=1 Tax=Rubrivirga sp. IMCC45206 TaxID=3391614 RepID=UPI00398FE2CC
MYVLVDYDNLLAADKARPLRDLSQRLADAVCAAAPELPDVLDIRFYGGWYALDAEADTHDPTPRAQELMAALTAPGDFPFVYRYVLPDQPTAYVRVRASLARSLLVDPARDLVRTLRPKALSQLLRPRSVRERCEHADTGQCCLRGLPGLVRHRACPDCSVPSADLVRQGEEQKLVDTMIAVDLVYAAASPGGAALVSSDDDFVPPIWQSVATGGTVYHVHTRPDRVLRPHYLPAAGLDYHSLAL